MADSRIGRARLNAITVGHCTSTQGRCRKTVERGAASHRPDVGSAVDRRGQAQLRRMPPRPGQQAQGLRGALTMAVLTADDKLDGDSESRKRVSSAKGRSGRCFGETIHE